MKSAPQHRSSLSSAPISITTPSRVVAGLLLVVLLMAGGCGTAHHRKPRTLGFIGMSAAVAGTGLWVAGQQSSDPGPVPTIGLGIVAVGIVAMIVAGGWIAAEVACQTDPDCDETEECREIPAPPGGVPYKQCMPR